MSFRGVLRWSLFAGYVAAFFCLPLLVLWDWPGFAVGIALSFLFLFVLGWHGTERTLIRLGARRQTRAQLPEVSAQVAEYCRRLRIPQPRLAIMDSPSLNLATVGFSRAKAYLVITRGALQGLSREALSALIGRELASIQQGTLFCEAWLGLFLSLLDSFAPPSRRGPAARRFYSFKLIVRQILLYPLTLFPAWILRNPKEAVTLDLKAIRMTQKPQAFAQGLKLLEAYHERIPLRVPFSTRHLFLLPPPPPDPLVRVFFHEERFGVRIRAAESLTHTVPLQT